MVRPGALTAGLAIAIAAFAGACGHSSTKAARTTTTSTTEAPAVAQTFGVPTSVAATATSSTDPDLAGVNNQLTRLDQELQQADQGLATSEGDVP